MKYSIEKIAWIDCIFVPMEDTNSVTIQILCKAWSIYETKEQSGIAHCLEHMFFKWWERYKTQMEVSEKFDSIGALFNAFTSNYVVSYYVKCAPIFVSQSIDVLADMMMNAKFDSAELDKEKWVIIQEMKMYEDNPMSLVWDKWNQRYFWENSYGRPIIGFEDTVMSFTHDDLQNYKNSLYTKDNLVIVMAWKWVDKDENKKLIEKYFAWMWERKSVIKPDFPNSIPESHISFYKKGTEQNHLIISAKWFDWKDDNVYAANVLTSILWWNMSSRLFQNVRSKEGLCYYISAYHDTGVDFGNFIIRAGMDKNRFEFWLQRIKEEIDNLVKNGVTQTEFDRAIWYLQWNFQMWIETSMEMAYFVGDHYLLYNEVETLDDILQKYKNLTLEDVNKLCEMLSLDKCYFFHIE